MTFLNLEISEQILIECFLQVHIWTKVSFFSQRNWGEEGGVEKGEVDGGGRGVLASWEEKKTFGG